MGKEQKSERLASEALTSEIKSKAENLFRRRRGPYIRNAIYNVPKSIMEGWKNQFLADSQISIPSELSSFTEILISEIETDSEGFWDFIRGKRVKDLTIHLNFPGTERCFLDIGEKPILETYSGKSVKASIKTLQAFSGLLDLMPQ
ncbi:MAG: hypothetical protein M1524_03725 [Patescibacteria group bacterium]|nr:hypothetical protein [Patescibacteria group bacterium]